MHLFSLSSLRLTTNLRSEEYKSYEWIHIITITYKLHHDPNKTYVDTFLALNFDIRVNLPIIKLDDKNILIIIICVYMLNILRYVSYNACYE